MRIGIDLGGTKIEAIALAVDGTEAVRRRIATPQSYTDTISALASLVHEVESEAGERCSVGVGIPGAITAATGVVKNANSTWLIGHPLASDLERALERAVRVMNDADCFTLSEATDGAAAGAPSVFGVILGTGVGGGIVVNGTCLQGPNLIAGEWGHNPLPWPADHERPGPECYCGKRGCIETWLSGPGFARDHATHANRTMTSHQIVSAWQAGDARARDSMERYTHRLARALATVINVLDPHVIVLGGGMSNIPDLATSVGRLLPNWVFSDSVQTTVVGNSHGDSSGVRGAAWLWPHVEYW